MVGLKKLPKRLKIINSRFLVLVWFLFAFLMVCGLQTTGYSTPVANAAQAPAIITYQGKLLNSGNLAVTTTVSVKFVLYDSLTGGNALYTAAGNLPTISTISISPTNGLFTVNLGDTGTNSLNPNIFQNNQSVYLEVTVASETLSPRKQITASPFAYNSKYLDGVAATSTASTSTYIPISDSSGNFNLRNVTSTGLVITGTSTLATTTIAGRLSLSSDGTNGIVTNVEGNLILKNNLTADYLSIGAGGVAPGGLTVFTNGHLVGVDGNTASFLDFFWNVTDSSTARAYTFDTKNALSTAGARLLSVKNSGVDKFYVDYSGGVSASGSLQITGTSTLLGKVLIGTSTAPSTNYQMFIDSGASTTPGLGVNGYIKASGFIAGTTTLDLAELYSISPACADTNSCPEPGDAVCVVANAQPAIIEKCSIPYSQAAIGIISTNPGFTLGGFADSTTRKVALAGRVPLNVKGPVKVGDRLTTSNTPGVAQVATEPGPTIGIALEDVPAIDNTTVLTLVNIGFSLDSQSDFSVVASPHTFLDTLTNWLRQLGVTIINGIVQAKEFIAEKITGSTVVAREHLCVGQTCITEDQLKQILGPSQITTTSMLNSIDQAIVDPVAAPAIESASSSSPPVSSPGPVAASSTETPPAAPVSESDPALDPMPSP